MADLLKVKHPRKCRKKDIIF